jgi:hypothetical protein
MISTQQLRDIGNNSKFKKINLPSSDKFTQPTYYQRKLQLCEKVKSLNTKLNGNVVTSALNENIIKARIIGTDEDVIKNLEQGFGNYQMHGNANKLAPELLGSSNTQTPITDYDNLLNYSENEKIKVFGSLLQLFNKNNVFNDNGFTYDECYFYGFKNPDSFIKSIMLIDNPSFIIKNKYDIHNMVSSYKNEFSMHFETLFKNEFYHLIPTFKTSYKVCRREFMRKETFSRDEIIQAYCDKNNCNMLVFVSDGNDFGFKVFVPHILTNNITITELQNMEWHKILLCYKSVYLPLIIPSTANKLSSSLFKVCNDNIEFINKTMYQYDYNEVAKGMEEFITKNSTMNATANLQKTHRTPVRMVIENNDKRLHKMRLEQKKRLHEYEETEDFGEIDKANEPDTDTTTEEVDITTEEKNTTTEEVDITTEEKNTTTSKIELKAIASYKLQDLQNLMSKYGLTTQKEASNGKMKNKTKKECYDELSAM